MGRHAEWRKIAKRERRRRIRTQLAKKRVLDASDEIPGHFQIWLQEQEKLEEFELEQIEKRNEEENQKWLQAEVGAMERWHKHQEKMELLRLQSLEQETKARMEWEIEQERIRKDKERLKEIEEENKRKQEIFIQQLEQFLNGDSTEPPPELMVSRETKPDCNSCPFFNKTACCRFGDKCSRNHKYPGISKVLLATNFYTHFGLENANYNEYDTDLMLEYEDSDTYKDFKEFFYDVLPEFERFGRILQFKVCNNHEKHLRGNTYIEFAELRCAVAAYRSLHSRWYGGKQLSLQFCNIISWKNAICGLQSTKRCPKGRACNFLHVFKNPNNLFNSLHNEYTPREYERSQKTPTYWRWSESPELETPRRRSRSRDRERKRRSRSRDRKERRRSRSRDKEERAHRRRKESRRNKQTDSLRNSRSRRKSVERRDLHLKSH